jgi:hypothetical protein
MSKDLRLSADVTLPLDAITQTFGVLAMRGAGKSNTAAVMAEEMFAAGLPFVVIDPVGAWWGLRSSGDGKGEGLSIPIFGGEHGDVPLEKTGGGVIADLLVDERLSCVLDVSEFSEGEKVRFLTEFGERLFRRNRDPLHLFLEEADDYIPQRPFREQARCLRAFENIVRRGRGRGLGMTMITQRSAALNKSVLTQVETLIVLRTTAPQDRKAIEAWVEHHGQSRELLASLPGLASGEAWIWSPQWLGKLVRTKVRRRDTFDSGATPKDVKGRRAPATLADVDLGAIRERMSATIERAKAEDPKELRRRIAELERQVAAKPVPAKPEIRTVDVPVVKDAHLARLEASLTRAEKIAEKLTVPLEQLQQVAANARAAAQEIRTAIAAAKAPVPLQRAVEGRLAPRPEPRVRAAPPPRAPSSGGEGVRLPPGERATLTAAAQFEGITRSELTVLTGYKRSSRDAYIQRLREKGYLEVAGDGVAPTAEGLAALGDFEPLPTGSALLAWWRERLPEGERRCLDVLAAAFPDAIPRTAIDEATGYQRSSRDAYLQRMKSKRLVEDAGRGMVRSSSALFDSALTGGNP